MDHRLSIGKRLYLAVLAIFLAFALTFILYQQSREKDYKITVLDQRLQDFNFQLGETFSRDTLITEAKVNAYLRENHFPDLRVTLIRPDGRVFFDSERKDYQNIPNHSNRVEIQEAMREGSGRTVDRKSATVPESFFYSATYFPHSHFIVRSALPYNDNLINILNTDKNYLWLSLVAIVLLTVVLYRFTHRLDKNLTKLRIFASRADHNETLEVEDLAEFPDDELGEIAEKIIKIYKRYLKTRKEQDELKRQLTHNIAHELKTPVASIQGYLETIIDHPDLDPKMLQMFLSRSYAQSQRLTSLLRDISTLNVMDEVTDMHGKENVDLAKLVIEIQQETALQFEQKHMTFEDKLPDHVMMRGVRSLLYSIFRNLTDNALAYAGEGTTVTVEVRETEEYWRFRFYDTGKGVPAEHLPRLFERFYRVDKGRSRAMGGTGLGLAIVKNAVLLHRGSIKVSNRKEGGLLFEFSLAKA
ncbi:sensor histidine kinase [Prevotella sp. AGR2160]|uniref:sensor histidine kinase n=1 Tax=Prevotella sp. AGR2160 TaxID=1280674 RepID=UPI00040E006E|nr:ATP-binding protein [Prevotella sp. AGR2160]